MSETKSRTITLTGRRPIKIREDEWPIFAEAKRGIGGAYERDWTRSWRLVVRQHADGRAIVYWAYETRWQGEHDRRGGELLTAGADLGDAIRRVGETLGNEDVIQDCLADLPAEDLTGSGAGLTDVAFDAAKDVGSIRYRLAPIDVGFDLRTHDMPIQIAAEEDPLRVSYADESGERRVMEGPRALVLEALERLGFRFSVATTEVHGARPSAIHPK